MEIKNIEVLSNLYAKIKELDSEILRLEKLGQKVAEGNCRIKMNLSVEDLSVVPAYKEPEETSMWTWSILRGETKAPPHPENVEELDDYLTLHMLGFLLKDKVQHREELLKEISKY